jgi:hypothetical protein
MKGQLKILLYRFFLYMLSFHYLIKKKSSIESLKQNFSSFNTYNWTIFIFFSIYNRKISIIKFTFMLNKSIVEFVTFFFGIELATYLYVK